jgi:hypothetical protein
MGEAKLNIEKSTTCIATYARPTRYKMPRHPPASGATGPNGRLELFFDQLYIYGIGALGAHFDFETDLVVFLDGLSQ